MSQQASDQSLSEAITAYEAKCIRVALAFGDPALVDLADEDLERAKAKLLAIEKRGEPS
jgi:hypothetical protein